MSPTGSNPPPPAPSPGASPADLPLLRRIADHLLTDPVERQRFFRSNRQFADSGVTDYFFASPRTGDRACDPDRVFHGLRWGGQFIYASPDPREAQHRLERFRSRPEFVIDHDLQPVPGDDAADARRGVMARLLPFLRRRHHFFVARKVHLTPVGVATDRYSYDVQLQRRSGSPDDYVVVKQVPTFEHAVERLALRFPDSSDAVIEKGARKLVNKVFPVFLTREAALLKIIHRDLPETHQKRFPRVLDLETDERGLVRKMRLNWLRLGGETISQLEFATQAAELLHVLHEHVGVIHLDLRLDNVVVTAHGVGFVDFGSAVRVGEDFADNPMLSALFGEMLSTSQIQRDLRRLVDKQKVTSPLFTDCWRKMDKAVDLFYLVLQMNNPHTNPDFQGLVHYDRQDAQAKQMSRLSRAVLNPRDRHNPRYRTARDVFEALTRLAA